MVVFFFVGMFMNFCQYFVFFLVVLLDYFVLGVVSLGGSFVDCIWLLIQWVGSVIEIVCMCGFFEGVVCSWCDGNSDFFCVCCVMLVCMLGIFLVWLVVGEGMIQLEVCGGFGEEQFIIEIWLNWFCSVLLVSSVLEMVFMYVMIDVCCVEVVCVILCVSLLLFGGEFDVVEQEQCLGEFYEIMGLGGMQIDVSVLFVFQQQFVQCLCCEVIV